MSDWLHNLPVPWMALVVFGFTYLLAAAIHAGVAVLAAGNRPKSPTAISPGMLAPPRIIFCPFGSFPPAHGWSAHYPARAGASPATRPLGSGLGLSTPFPCRPGP